MASYTAPLRDMRFVYHELHSLDALAELPGYEEATPDIIDAVLEEAGRFCSEVLAPLNRTGDEEGCLLEDGIVRTPEGFVDAYTQFVDGGWNADRRATRQREKDLTQHHIKRESRDEGDAVRRSNRKLCTLPTDKMA